MAFHIHFFEQIYLMADKGLSNDAWNDWPPEAEILAALKDK
jgi:hypothetical protein